ncbi:hypothetical protein SAMN05216464_10570 [Mucilaginibacter pineti]|uniref:Uncharacterized protein n=1 Tax=Mucilaginibacter pineti TaxID=1391627 RepID=A0A1G7BLA6_9SPHI|nr:DUF6624 domain-containing protein [Mucilaginibacter pineti]SDE27697.1 hypothetical protein SAMN05216464_10570 [Mucilaginibacter pineti]
MKIFILLSFICGCLALPAFAQTHNLNTPLIEEINAMYKDDQFWRLEDMKAGRKQKSTYSADDIQKNWATADSINEIKAKAIIKKYGYPGYTLVGKDASQGFWAIIQHCDDDVLFQKLVLALMKKEVDRKNASKSNYALLTDRILVSTKQKQIYGTQLSKDLKTNKLTPFPLKYPDQVDKLRKQMDLEPLADYIKSFER